MNKRHSLLPGFSYLINYLMILAQHFSAGDMWGDRQERDYTVKKQVLASTYR